MGKPRNVLSIDKARWIVYTSSWDTVNRKTFDMSCILIGKEIEVCVCVCEGEGRGKGGGGGAMR